MEEEAQKEKTQLEYQQKLSAAKAQEEARLAKNRKKRLKEKQRKNAKKTGAATLSGTDSDSPKGETVMSEIASAHQDKLPEKTPDSQVPT